MEFNKQQRIIELSDTLDHISLFLNLLNSGDLSYVKEISVALRKLYFKGQGDNLLRRIELDFNNKIIFKTRVEDSYIPPTYKDSTIDEYVNELRFFHKNEKYSRLDIIKLYADTVGAHFDDEKTLNDRKRTFHSVGVSVYDSEHREVYPILVKYLVDIARNTLMVCKNYLINIQTTIFNLVKYLNLPLGQYVVVGGGVLAAHGIRDCKDIDILITRELFDELKKAGWTVKVTSGGSTNVVNGIVEAGSDIIYCKNYEPDIAKVIKEADIISGIPFMNLHELVKFKKALGREKDLVDVGLVEEYLKK